MPHLSLGVLLVVACATTFAIMSTQLDDRVSVLALAEPVSVGQILTVADLREISVAAGPGLSTIPSSQAGNVVGSRSPVSLPAGSLLSPVMLGQSALPSAGEAIVALALAPGRFPPEVSPGARVVIVPTPAGPTVAAAENAAASWSAVVVGVHPTMTDATTVISVQLSDDVAGPLAATGSVSVVMISESGD